MLDTLIPIIKQAGELSRAYFSNELENDVDFKTPVDLVTTADREVEQYLKDALAEAFPDIRFDGEESGEGAGSTEHGVFIVDPIDGTTNFFHRYPFYSVSLAYRKDDITECGLVYCPPTDELFYAERGGGAFRNGRPIRVSQNARLQDALMVTGFSCVRFNVKPDTMAIFDRMVYLVRDIHRDGSAALDLCYVACGIYDLFWELNLNAWDVAAGVLICDEAGGRVSDFGNSDQFEKNRQLVASNGAIHHIFLQETTGLC